MAGHPALSYVKEKRDIVSVGGQLFNVNVSYHNVKGVDGFVTGIKFSDRNNSMDSSIKGSVGPYKPAASVAEKVIKLITPDIDTISILGFYLLTNDLDARMKGGGELKRKMYKAYAIQMHEQLVHKLPYITQIEGQARR